VRRFFLFDKFNTWHDWRLTLTAKDTTDPEPKTNYVALDGMSGTLDLTESLTGEVAYNDRTVTAAFWTSEGTYQEREAAVKQITASLHGKKVKIVEPDDPDHYFLGRCMVTNLERSQVHVAFEIEAVCDPWRYAVNESNRSVSVNGTTSVVIRNEGVKTLCPNITVAGTVTLSFEGGTVELTTGAYKVADIKLRQGVNVIGVAGDGSVTFTYREATL
jgi:hypothetical protein